MTSKALNTIGHRTRRLTRAAAAAGCALLAGLAAGTALAQDGAANGESGACPVAHCLDVELAPALTKALSGEAEVAFSDLADGVSLTYRGETPFAVRLIAARYDDGRLVRYGVSPRTELKRAGENLEIKGLGKTFEEAFSPRTSDRVSLHTLDNARLSAREDIAGDAFIGEVPAAFLAGTDPVGLVPIENVKPEMVAETFAGSIGVLVVLPDDGSIRGPKQVRLRGALIGLDYATQPVETAESD